MHSYANPVYLPVHLVDAQAANTVTKPGTMITEGGKLTNVRVMAVNGLAGATPATFTLSFGVTGDVAKFGTFVASGTDAGGKSLTGVLTLETENFRNLDEEPILITCAAPAAAAAGVELILAYY